MHCITQLQYHVVIVKLKYGNTVNLNDSNFLLATLLPVSYCKKPLKMTNSVKLKPKTFPYLKLIETQLVADATCLIFTYLNVKYAY